MVFSSNIFLFLFLPATIVGYNLLHKPYRNTFLLCMSLFFYAYGEPKFVLALIISIIFNYIMVLLVEQKYLANTIRRFLLFFCIAGNLGLLCTFKYLGFLISNINRFGLNVPLVSFALPIGISFFTFQAISYAVDVYRKDVEIQKKPQNLGLFISFFPQLIAGPIIRYKEIENYIENRDVNFSLFSDGAERFIIGFSKKVLLANNMAVIADIAFSLPDYERSAVFAWLGAIAYSFQIFFDFSGYSDMAIGLGRMFGFRFPENFNYPYLSKSISEFWRRWHMSLGRWFRDYVYFPLGGSRVKTKARMILNLFIVWCLTGVWHGASWNFIFWGLWYFVLIVFEKLTGCPKKFKSTYAITAYRSFTLLCILEGWILFRAADLNAAIKYSLSMLGFTNNTIFCDNVILALREYWLFLIASLIISTGLLKLVKLEGIINQNVRFTASTVTMVFYVFCFIWAISFLIMGANNPFIYFNF